MAAKPLTTEAIALTEKKMDMTLDDIIKMSKNPSTNKPKKQQRMSNKSEKSFNTVPLNKSAQVRHYMDSRSSLRQAALAQRRSNFQRNQFPLAAEHARKVLVAPIHSRPFNYYGRAGNLNAPRVGVAPVQRVLHGRGFIAKKPAQQQAKVLPKQRPQTLDSLFANMKEERMRVLSQQNTAGRRIIGGQQRQQWGRGRFGN